MAKATKVIKPVVKKIATTPAAEAPASKRTVNRPAVLIKKTAAELRDLIGADTPIGVSRKELSAIILKNKSADILGEAGL